MTSVLSTRRSVALLPTVAVAAALAYAAPAFAGSIPAADPSRLGSQPVGEINDVVLKEAPGTARAAAWSPPPGASGGTYEAGGMAIRIYASPDFTPDPARSQSWAEFFAGLPQDGDAPSMIVYFVSDEEMSSLCSEDSVACYYTGDNLMVLTGDETAVDGTPIEEAAAHEFAHHLANRRSNDPWPALDWGPKRWSSQMRVCQGVRAGELFPGNQGSQYANDPGEGRAEAYRVAVGQGTGSWDIVNPKFRPDATDRAIALLDATDPWTRNRVRNWSGRFSRGRSSLRRIRVPTPLDGRFRLRLSSSRGLDVDIYVYDASNRRLVKSGRQYGRSETVSTTVCGGSSYNIYLKRSTRRTGSYRLSLTWPG